MQADDRLARAIKTLVLILLSLALAAVIIWFLSKIRTVVVILVGTIFFAYLIYPAVRRFQRRMPRWLAIVCAYLLLAIVISGVVSYVGPRISYEAKTFGADLPGFMRSAQDAIVNAHASILTVVPLQARESVANGLDQVVLSAQAYAGAVAAQVLRIALSVATVITSVVIVLVLTFYILLDIDRIQNGLLYLFPVNQRAQAISVIRDVDSVLGGFIRGQVIVGAIIAVVVTLMLLLLRIKYAFLIGAFAGVVDIIPYVGAVAGAIPAILIAIFTHGLGWAVIVAAGFIAIYQLEGHVIAPNIVGQRVGLTPLMVIIAILIGAELGGIGGMFVSVPIAGILRVLWRRFLLPQAELETHPLVTNVHEAPSVTELKTLTVHEKEPAG